MSAEPIHYSKLPGPGFGWPGWTRLWLAGDHLLEMNWTIFTERYHRYFLHDIRGVIAQRTKTGRMWNIALGSFAALGLAIGGAFFLIGGEFGRKYVSKENHVEFHVAFWIFAGMFAGVALVLLLALLINALLGPTCRFYIQTTAGTQLLAAPTRLRRAQRLLARLVPHIEAAQSAVLEPSALS